MHSIRPVAMFLALVLALTGSALAAGKGRLIGMVFDPAGRPIPDVTVTLKSLGESSFQAESATNKVGTFNMKFGGGDPVYQIALAREGFRSFQGELALEAGDTSRFEFTMYRADSSTEEANIDPSTQIIETTCFRSRDVRHYTGIHHSGVYAQCNRNEHILLTLKGPCIGLEGSLRIWVVSRSERVCSDTRAAIMYEDQNNLQAACAVRRVEAVEGQTEAERLMKSRMGARSN
jgi:hypothetical protein